MTRVVVNNDSVFRLNQLVIAIKANALSIGESISC